MRKHSIFLLQKHTRMIYMAWVILFLAIGCSPVSGAKISYGTEYVIFIDFSLSIQGQDRRLFEQELLHRVVPTLDAGDRILIAPITDETLTKFRPLVESTLPFRPKFNGWSDNLLQHRKEVKQVDTQIPQIKDKIRADISDMFSKHYTSTKTDIFSALIIAQKLFHKVPRHKVLILMSDMIEDYPPYRFDKVSWTKDGTHRLLNDLEADGRIPKLPGVCVYISGASANSPDMAEQISSFWYGYFDRANADLHPSRYAHVLLHWPPSKSCSI